MKKLLIPFLVFSLTACSLAPDYHRPDVGNTGQWKGNISQVNDVSKNWWTAFNSAELSTLIDTAQKNNTDLRAGLQRIEQSRAQVKITRSSLFPDINANADLSFSDSKNDSSKSYGGGVAASYEVDLWKKNSDSTKSAKSHLTATQFDQDALQLVVTGDIAQDYFNILALKERLRITQETLKTFQETMKIIQARFDEGAASGLDVSQEKVTLINAEASIETLKQNVTTTEDAIAVLLGQMPQNYQENFTVSFNDLTIPTIAAVQPATLLGRRPDIRSQEENLKAANADIGVARAALFPSLSLSASASTLDNPTFSALNLVTGVASSLVVSIFNGGRLTGAVENATARQKELVETYHGAVLTAFQETQDALVAAQAAQIRDEKYDSALKEAHTAYDIAHDRYTSGADDFTTLLEAQRSLLQAQDNHVQARLDRLTAALSLFRAMGGGWSS
jgi:NodT family efflux transporter outer membrane factor (OMF) lipoprotein